MYYQINHFISRKEKRIHVPIYKVPHYCLRKVFSQEDMTIYIFFPNMYSLDKATNFPRKLRG